MRFHRWRPMPGEITFPMNKAQLGAGLVVGDAEALAAMAAAFRHLKVVAEPGGATALAAALTGRFDCRDRCVLVVISGGNVDAETFRRALDG